MRIIDLTVPIRSHWRWKTSLRQLHRFEDGDPFQVTELTVSVHAFTHVDAPRHCVPDGITIEQVDLQRCCGEAAVLDLTWVGPNQAIGAAELAKAGDHLRRDDIALIATGWPRKSDIASGDFWKNAPFVTADGSKWLGERGIRAAGFDFPQDYVIRLGVLRPVEESPAHDLLLRHGVIQIEYLTNLDRIGQARVEFYALPLKIVGADGSPARAIAIVEE